MIEPGDIVSNVPGAQNLNFNNFSPDMFDLGGVALQHGGEFGKYAYGAVLQAALSRQQLQGAIPQQQKLWEGLDSEAANQLNRVRGDNYAALLSRSGLGSTSSGIATGLEAARAAGGGGGFSRGLAMRAATGAAGAQSAAVTDAVVRGQLGQRDQEASLTSLLTQTRQAKAQSLSNLYGAESEMSFNIAALLSGLATQGAGFQNARTQAKAGITQSVIGAGAQLGSAAINAAG